MDARTWVLIGKITEHLQLQRKAGKILCQISEFFIIEKIRSHVSPKNHSEIMGSPSAFHSL